MANYIGNKHTVQSGESLSAIAAENGTDWQTLYALNKDHLRSGNPDVIYPGENLVLPDNAKKETATATVPQNEVNDPITVKERNAGTRIVSRPNGTDAGDPNERVVYEEFSYSERTIAATKKPATDAIAGDVAALENARQQMQIAQDAQNNVANENKLLVKQLEAKNNEEVRKQKATLAIRANNIKSVNKVLSKKPYLPTIY
jgi:murein DD-endopeptidase MepM/ murein hydrolase activator NlpD